MLFRTVVAAALVISATAPLAAAEPDNAGASTATAQAVNPDDRVRCRKVSVTGSLVKGEKVCKTVGEWKRLSERGNDVAREYIGEGRVCAGGACGNGG